MSKETKPRKPRSSKKSDTAELEAKIAELEAKLANLSSQVKPEARPAQTSPPPPPKPQPRPAASGPTHGTLPAGMKPAPKPEPRPEPQSYSAPEPGEVAPAYAQVSSSGYTGNKYFATRKRLSFHPADKQFTGTKVATTTASPPPPPQYYEPAPEPKPQRGTLPAGTKPQEKKSSWKAKGSEVAETYTPQEEHKAPPPPPKPTPSGSAHGTLPAGMKPAPRPEPKPAQTSPPPPPKPQPRPAASGPTHGTLPAGMKPAPKPEPRPEPQSYASPEPTEVAPAYAQISSSGYTGNRYYATRRRLSYHPADKQFTGSRVAETSAAPPPPPPKKMRGTLPAGFKP